MPLRFPALVRRALQRGAVSRVARSLFAGTGLPAIRRTVQDIFGLPSGAPTETVIRFGSQAREAGRQTQDLEPGASPEHIRPPIISALDPEFFQGGRFVYETEITWENIDTGQTGTWFLRVPTSDLASVEDLFQAAQAIIDEVAGYDPGRFGGSPSAAIPTIAVVDVVDAQARY